jgi:hypothetical protein
VSYLTSEGLQEKKKLRKNGGAEAQNEAHFKRGKKVVGKKGPLLELA